jgi:ribonuclease HI
MFAGAGAATGYTEIVKSTAASATAPVYHLSFDGGAVPNPGRAGSAAVISDTNGKILYECGEFIQRATNNVAEYGGLIIGLRLALKRGISRLLIQGDSNLVISQISGKWAVNDPKMKGLYNEASSLLKQFQYVGCRHVYRSNNTRADALADEVIQGGRGFERSLGPLAPALSPTPTPIVSRLEAPPASRPGIRLYDYDEALWRIKETVDGVFTDTDKETIAEIRAILERTLR